MNTTSLDSLASRVGYLREHSGLDQAALSELCGLSQSHLGQIVRGDVTKPAPDTLVRIARALGVSLEWLMTGAGKTPSDRRIKSAVERARPPGDSETSEPKRAAAGR